MSNSTNDDDLNLKSNKIFAEELKRWGMILELYFADDIKVGEIVNVCINMKGIDGSIKLKLDLKAVFL